MSANAIVMDAIMRLAIARSAPPLDDMAMEVYVEGLDGEVGVIVQRACAKLAKQPREAYTAAMPSVGDIRSVCADLARSQSEAAKQKLLGPAPGPGQTFYCLDCHDEPSGWRTFWCMGRDDMRPTPDHVTFTIYPCGRTGRHVQHSYVERCDCLPHNPEIAKHKARMAAARGRVAEQTA